MSPILSRLALTAALLATCHVAVWAAEPPREPLSAGEAARATQLIRELGAQSYATRQRAQAELWRIGLPAFDALEAAQANDDVEIALRARNLVARLRVAWVGDEPNAQIRQMLEKFADQAPEERQQTVDQLGQMTDGIARGALCRLARFEEEDQIAKRAALRVIQMPVEDRRKVAHEVSQIVAMGSRPALHWLRLYADTLVDPKSGVDGWKQAIDRETRLLELSPNLVDRPILQGLIQWVVAEFDRAGEREAAGAAIEQSVGLLQGETGELLETLDWLIDRGEWGAVEKLSVRFKREIESDSLLIYRLAEAMLRQDRQEAADALAEQAREKDGENVEQHIISAYRLEDRGLTHWAEKAYRHAISKSDPTSLESIRARILLSEMLFDHGRALAGAETLEPVVEILEKDARLRGTLPQRLGREAAAIAARMHYFYAVALNEQGQGDKSRGHIKKAVQADPSDVDAIIAFYRVPGADNAWREQALTLIRTTAQDFERQIDAAKSRLENAPDESNRQYAQRLLAQGYNQYAWLISNTQGDYEKAVRYSLRSLELNPGSAGYLDTLGRCYYAAGDIENAIKYQSRAVELEPHTGAIVRQLEFFQREAAERQSAVPAPPEPRK